MYILKEEASKKIRKERQLVDIAKEVGISLTYVSLVFAGKKTCPKTVAFCITKIVDMNAEIEDFFIKVR